MKMFSEHRLIHRLEEFEPGKWRRSDDLSVLWGNRTQEEHTGWEIAEEQVFKERNIQREIELYTSGVTQRFTSHIDALLAESAAHLDASEKQRMATLAEEMDARFERHLKNMERYLENMITRVRADLTTKMDDQIRIIDRSIATIKSYIEVRY